ncbi:hypothetical protein J2W91_004581 [Paenibacillus amylolyticus]|uniref:Uncharacterized protein n=1 Tax=Paenibacillus amylolyticus TaxID=1451 RepID=A0AAP5H494_PAEAM|nr:hypothetical protein [Paenibacillus amylolyticus]
MLFQISFQASSTDGSISSVWTTYYECMLDYETRFSMGMKGLFQITDIGREQVKMKKEYINDVGGSSSTSKCY